MNIDYSDYVTVVNGFGRHAQVMVRRVNDLLDRLKEAQSMRDSFAKELVEMKDQLVQRECQITSLEAANKRQEAAIKELQRLEQKLTAFGAKKGGKK